MTTMTHWHALVLSLPARHGTTRMRVWRALKETGCGVLRDGVYVLPRAAERSAVLRRMEGEIQAAGGFAMTVELQLKTPAQRAHVRKLFDRSGEYGALVREADAARKSLSRLGARKAQTAVSRLQRSFDALSQIDFFPGQARTQALNAMSSLHRHLKEAYSGGEPRKSGTRPRKPDVGRYAGRVWATRKDLWVDRLASAWLIKRFIDRDATFAWIERPRDRPKGSVGFDFDGAEFTHTGNRVTFEALSASFGLDGDPAVAAIGAAVHFLDIGGIPVADAKGLETLLRGAEEKAGTTTHCSRRRCGSSTCFTRPTGASQPRRRIKVPGRGRFTGGIEPERTPALLSSPDAPRGGENVHQTPPDPDRGRARLRRFARLGPVRLDGQADGRGQLQ
jgi:hypothetical protein